MKNEKLRKYMVGIGLIFIGLIIITNFTEFKNPIINEQEIITPISAIIHDTIWIDGNAELASFCSEGSGTSNDPYIIEGYEISAMDADGIKIVNTTAFLTIRDCFVKDGIYNDWNGINLWDCSNINLINNNCSENNGGIYMRNSFNNTFSDNSFSFNNYFGMYLDYSDNNTISNNNCSFNGFAGIRVVCSNNNIIWENYFIGNPEVQADSDNSVDNCWDWNGKGNYWGDYEVRYPNANNDGVIWNIPYEITPGVFDEYPLVLDTPPTWVKIPFEYYLLNGESLHYGVSASDELGIDSYWLNDTTHFQIDSDGIISNTTDLDVGTYGLEIHVNDTTGHEIVREILIYVLENLPIASFSINATSIYEGEWIQFTDETHHGFLPYTYEWDFGDGSINNTQQNPIHQFDTNGTFWVTLTVYDVTGNSSSTDLQITVLKPIMDDNNPFSFIDGYDGLIMISLISIIGVLWVSSRKR